MGYDKGSVCDLGEQILNGDSSDIKWVALYSGNSTGLVLNITLYVEERGGAGLALNFLREVIKLKI